jgi:hypothetical protein
MMELSGYVLETLREDQEFGAGATFQFTLPVCIKQE